MGLPLETTAWTLDSFLDWEALQSERHEFVGGEIVAMVGARRIHGMAVLNLATFLRAALRHSRCRVFAESMKVRAGTDIVYPDVFVTCDPADLRTEQIFRAPTVVAEVLSPSTEGYDRGRKFERYRALASLREFLLIDPDALTIELYRRGAEHEPWTLEDVPMDGSFTLRSIDVTVPAAEVFDGIEPAPEQP